MKKADWDEYFLEIAHSVAKYSTCKQRQVGAVLVKDKQILATGYNGAPFNLRNCLESGCLKEKNQIPTGVGKGHESCRAVHAEQNIIIQCALHGISTRDAIIYCTYSPCVVCAKMLINAEISRIVVYKEYPDKVYRKLFKQAGIVVNFIQKY